jgi:hypothetical protein
MINKTKGGKILEIIVWALLVLSLINLWFYGG